MKNLIMLICVVVFFFGTTTIANATPIYYFKLHEVEYEIMNNDKYYIIEINRDSLRTDPLNPPGASAPMLWSYYEENSYVRQGIGEYYEGQMLDVYTSLEGVGYYWGEGYLANYWHIGSTGTLLGSNGDVWLEVTEMWQKDVAPVPEPSTMLLFGTGLIGVAGWSSRKLKKY